MKQHNPSKKSSRRNFTKSIACALAATPIVSTYGSSPQPGAETTEPAHLFNTMPTVLSPAILKDHIPEIEISSDSLFKENRPAEVMSGSVFLNTEGGNVSEPNAENPRKQFFLGKKQIIGVRVIMADGQIAVDYPKNDQRVTGGKIRIWVKVSTLSPMSHDILLSSTTGPNQKLQVEFSNNTFFGRDNGCPGNRREKRKYSESMTGLLKVEVLNADGKTPDGVNTASTNIPDGKEIDRILIWTSKVS
jgi:hypothetical protein